MLPLPPNNDGASHSLPHTISLAVHCPSLASICTRPNSCMLACKCVYPQHLPSRLSLLTRQRPLFAASGRSLSSASVAAHTQARRSSVTLRSSEGGKDCRKERERRALMGVERCIPRTKDPDPPPLRPLSFCFVFFFVPLQSYITSPPSIEVEPFYTPVDRFLLSPLKHLRKRRCFFGLRFRW